ncbi:MAG TPA: ATP synthase F1 subunit delta [Chitinophagaceae bacterium]|nr:ATP synthase F1 subunit delta [Chitinophagaceae bacterium]MCB9055415.1 ATP synthase F1 subunit delta [Chitinophagales bacterium]HPG11378.1 ATP synthase F1 subunit delta [Chitinophagaceae bacterium]HRX93898.1 ATP synthase F1 subunit delta [Chitinophagaceae bacterium]
MHNPRLAARYAKAIVDLSIEKGQLETVYADMQWLQGVCKSNRDFVNLLRSPIVKSDIKKKIFGTVSAGRIGELTKGFVDLLITKHRENKLPEIITAFIEVYKEYNNIHDVTLTTATPVDDNIRNAILDQIRKTTGFEKIELEEKVNPALIGGLVLRMGDQLIDASIAYDLKTIARQFENNDFLYRIR